MQVFKMILYKLILLLNKLNISLELHILNLRLLSNILLVNT